MRLAPAAFSLPLAAAIVAAAPAAAQTAAQPIAPRVDKLEREMRAVQRKVFPGGASTYFEPEMAAPAPAAAPAGTPADSAVFELTSRVDTLEKELARLTGQIEQNGYRLKQVEDGLAAMRADTEARRAQEAAPLPPIGAAAPATIEATPAPRTPARRPAAPAATVVPADEAPAPAAAPAPSSGDPGEDAYMAGYRLWEQKKYPEAQAALKDVVAKYPKHKRASYAQNLLGRAYLDDGKPAIAAEAFYANYQKMPRGERAPDSLYYLGQSLVRLKKNAEACKVYDELTDVYGATLKEPLKGRVATARTEAKCGA
ncbi:MAG: tetratricopeptide repeat protein [Sphingomonas fennica]